MNCYLVWEFGRALEVKKIYSKNVNQAAMDFVEKYKNIRTANFLKDNIDQIEFEICVQRRKHGVVQANIHKARVFVEIKPEIYATQIC